MKRSFINKKIEEAIEFCNRMNFHLPKWAYWTIEQWCGVGIEADEIRNHGLGWDVTDFGSGDFDEVGLLAFTIRNGDINSDDGPSAKTYCEKLMIVQEGQLTPTHFHWSKMEDIINRGGGNLIIQLWNAFPETEELDMENEIDVTVDGIIRTIKPGGKITLEPGESITLMPYMYHNFYAQKGCGKVLAGEVSKVNDDEKDNRFYDPLPRFTAIDEDETAKYYLCNEY